MSEWTTNKHITFPEDAGQGLSTENSHQSMVERYPVSPSLVAELLAGTT